MNGRGRLFHTRALAINTQNIGPAKAVDVPTSAFLGMNAEIAPIDLPEGASPDNQDVQFTPGSLKSRPGLHRLFAPGGTTTETYFKSFIQPNGNPLNLFLESDGSLYQEDVANNPGVRTLIATVPAGLYAQSVTAFGREWLAFSDGLHGADIPRQWDGTNFDRATQDGPAQAPTVTPVTTKVNITSVTLSVLANISSITESGFVCTVTTATPHGITQPGTFVTIAGSNVPGYNGGAYQVGQIVSSTVFTVTNAGSGLGNAGAFGTVGLAQVTVVCAANHGLQVGDAVVLEGNDGTYNNGADTTSHVPTPNYWIVIQIVNATTFIFGLSGASGTINTTTLTNGTNVGTVAIGGMIAPGPHQCTVSFLTRQDLLTKPAPPVTFFVQGNPAQVSITNLPIGPSNVLARVLEFTGAGGGNFFTFTENATIQGNSLLFNGTTPPPTVVKALIIPDNTTTSVTVDFPDNTLLAGEGIDIPGNNLFAQRTLGPCLGFTFYASRLGAWGEWRRVENFLNMGFESSGVTPDGWTPTGTAGALVTAPADFGMAWQITGDGVNHRQGGLQQSAYQDYLGVAILEPSTQYSLRLWAKASAAGLLGTLVATISSASTGFSATATININAIPNTRGAFLTPVAFGLAMPAVIPSDLLFTINCTGLNNGATVTIDEIEIIFTLQPYLDDTASFSYAQNPEAHDAITGKFGATDDATPIRCFAGLRYQLVMQTAGGLHRTVDNESGEPDTWSIDQVSRTVGALSFRSGDAGKFGTGDTGEEWIVIASYAGLYLYGGGPLWKVSQEIQPVWDRINYAAAKALWVKNDPGKRRVYIGLPLDQATAASVIMVMDYRELDTDQQIAAAQPVHTSIMGHMIATDMARKWTRWSLAMNYAETLARPNGVYTLCLGAGNGVTPGGQAGFGNCYFLDDAKLTDDDYGAMVPYWISYFFVNHEQEQALQLGSFRKLYLYSAYYVTGVGLLVVTPYMGNLANPWTSSLPRQLNQTQNADIEIPLNIGASRVAFKIAVIPLQGTTDVQLNLQKMIITMRKHPMSPTRGAR